MSPSGCASPVPVALLLLDQRWPPGPRPDGTAPSDVLDALANDPRYLIGRFQCPPLLRMSLRGLVSVTDGVVVT
jgi:hypothetical protein